MNIDILYIKDLKNLISYKDKRSIAQYCHRNNVEILGKGKRQYVLSVQFKRALLQERICDLKSVYGDKFIEVLKSEMSLYAKLQSILDESKKEKGHSTENKNKTTPKGEHKNRFALDIFNELELPLDTQE